MKRLLCLLIAVVMAVGIFPLAALGAVTPPPPSAVVTDVSVTPSPTTVERGGLRQFTGTVFGSYLTPADRNVIWNVAGGSATLAAGTTISQQGLLTVAPNQALGTLTVTAQSTINPLATGTATVTIVADTGFIPVTSVSVLPRFLAAGGNGVDLNIGLTFLPANATLPPASIGGTPFTNPVLRWQVTQPPGSNIVDPAQAERGVLVPIGNRTGQISVHAIVYDPREASGERVLQPAFTITVLDGVDLAPVSLDRNRVESGQNLPLIMQNEPTTWGELRFRWETYGGNADRATISADSVFRATLPPGATDNMIVQVRLVIYHPTARDIVLSHRVFPITVTPPVVPVQTITLPPNPDEGLRLPPPPSPGVSFRVRAGQYIPLRDVVVDPSTATNQAIEWSVESSGGMIVTLTPRAGYPQSLYWVNASRAGRITIRATVVDGVTWDSHFHTDFVFEVVDEFVPVESIGHALFGPEFPQPFGTAINLTELTRINPFDATNTNIVWQLLNDGNTGATLYQTDPSNADNNEFILENIQRRGNIRVRATIEDGRAVGQDFTQEFTIHVYPPGALPGRFIPVDGIRDVPTLAQVGVPLILTGTPFGPDDETPTNATIASWRIVSAEFTGAVLQPPGNRLGTSAEGRVVVEATITDGLGEGMNFSARFTILVSTESSPPPPGFIRVSNITGVPGTARPGQLPLRASVFPTTATAVVDGNPVTWEIVNAADNTVARLLPNNILSTEITGTGNGEVTVVASIADGYAPDQPTSREFTITINPNADPGSGQPGDGDGGGGGGGSGDNGGGGSGGSGSGQPGPPASATARITGISSDADLGANVTHIRRGSPNQDWEHGSQVRPGEYLLINLTAEMFEWEGEAPANNAAVTRAHLTRGNIGVNMNRRRNGNLISSVSLIGTGNDPAQIRVSFIDVFNSTQDREFEVTVFLTENRRRHQASEFSLVGTMYNVVAYIDSYDDLIEGERGWYFDMRDTPVIHPTRTFRRVGLQLDYGVTVYATLAANRRVALAARSGITNMSSTDEQLYLRYDSLVQIIHIEHRGLNTDSAMVAFDVEDMNIRLFHFTPNAPRSALSVSPVSVNRNRMYVHDAAGRFLGPIDGPNREFPFSPTYYITNQRILMNIANPGTPGTIDPPIENFPPGNGTNNNDNPLTGRAPRMEPRVHGRVAN